MRSATPMNSTIAQTGEPPDATGPVTTFAAASAGPSRGRRALSSSSDRQYPQDWHQPSPRGSASGCLQRGQRASAGTGAGVGTGAAVGEIEVLSIANVPQPKSSR